MVDILYFETAKSLLHVLSFEQNVFSNKAKLMFKVVNNLILQFICDLFQQRSVSVRGLFKNNVDLCSQMLPGTCIA